MKNITKQIESSIKGWITKIRRADSAVRSAGQHGAFVAAEIMHELGATYDEAIGVLKSKLKEAGERPQNVNRSRDLIPFAFSNYVALATGDVTEWPSVREAKAILARAGVDVSGFFEEGDDWSQLVESAYLDAKLELERAAAKRGDDDYAPSQDDVLARVAAFKRESDAPAAPAATAERSDDDAVLAVIQARRKGMTPEGKTAAIKLLQS